MTTVATAPKQIPLRFAEGRIATFELFVADGNAEAVAALSKSAGGSQPLATYIWGQRGCGKTHLLQAACRRAATLDRAATLVPLRGVSSNELALFDGLEQLDLVCVDDLDAIAGQTAMETAVFSLFNRCRDSCASLVLSGSGPPNNLGLALNDLVSRLEWGLVFQLRQLDDAKKIEAMRRRADQRGFELPADVGLYILAHLPRDMSGLMAVLDRLDEATLSQRRHLTIPFVRTVLSEQQ